MSELLRRLRRERSAERFGSNLGQKHLNREFCSVKVVMSNTMK